MLRRPVAVARRPSVDSIVLAEMRRFVVNFVVAVGHGTSAAPSGASSFPRIAIISAARC